MECWSAPLSDAPGDWISAWRRMTSGCGFAAYGRGLIRWRQRGDSYTRQLGFAPATGSPARARWSGRAVVVGSERAGLVIWSLRAAGRSSPLSWADVTEGDALELAGADCGWARRAASRSRYRRHVFADGSALTNLNTDLRDRLACARGRPGGQRRGWFDALGWDKVRALDGAPLGAFSALARDAAGAYGWAMRRAGVAVERGVGQADIARLPVGGGGWCPGGGAPIATAWRIPSFGTSALVVARLLYALLRYRRQPATRCTRTPAPA
jgi:hypothetical protein